MSTAETAVTTEQCSLSAWEVELERDKVVSVVYSFQCPTVTHIGSAIEQ